MKIIVEGDFACFTNITQYGCNKYTYDIPTVTAITGLLKNIFWKPAIEYKINEIRVFNPIKKTKMGISRLKNFTMEKTIIGIEVLQNVKYGIDFDVVVVEKFAKEKPKKHNRENYTNQISKRLKSGTYYHLPHLGLSLFPCRCITHIHTDEKFPEVSPLLKGEIKYENVVYSMEFEGFFDEETNIACFDNNVKRVVCFDPIMKNGIIDIKNYEKEGGIFRESYNRIM